MRFSSLLVLPMLASCGGTVTESPTTPFVDRTSAPIHGSERDAFPQPLEVFVPQTLGTARESLPWRSPVAVVSLAERRFCVVTGTTVVITDEHFHVVDRFEADVRSGRIFGTIDSGATVIARHGRFDFASGERVRGAPEGEYYAADDDGRRFVRVLATPERLSFAIDDADGREQRRIELTSSEMLSHLGPDPADDPSDEFDDQPDLTFDAEVPLSQASIRGDRLEVTVDERAICRFSIDDGSLTDCSRVGERLDRLELYGEFGSACDREDGVACRPARSEAESIPTETDGARFVVERLDDHEFRIAAAASGRVLVDHVVRPASGSFAFGGSRFAFVDDGVVRFFGTDGPLGVASLEPRQSPRRSRLRVLSVRSDDERFVAVDEFLGLAFVAPGDAGVRFGLAFERAVPIETDEGRFTLRLSADRVFRFGLDLAPTRPSIDEPVRSARVDPDPGRDAVAREYRSSVRAYVRRDSGGFSFAFVVRGRLRVVDDDGRDLVRPVRLPPTVARSGCSELAFLSDSELALSGPGECIPTRIHVREGRTEPLASDFRFAATAITADGARSIVFEDGRVRVLDGRTGATIVAFDPRVEGAIGASWIVPGRKGVVFGERHTTSFEILPGADDSAAAEVRVREVLDHFVDLRTLDETNGVVVSCESSGEMRLADAFSESDVSVRSRACDLSRASTLPRFDSRSIPGFVAAQSDGDVTFVRLRDHAVLELRIVATSDDLALLLLSGDSVLGVHPPDSGLVASRDPATNELLALAAPGEPVARVLASFFESP